MSDFKPYNEIKNWGQVQHVFCNEHAAVSLLEVVRGQRCSRHFHRQRANLFAVLEGCLIIQDWPDGMEGPSNLYRLGPGDAYVVPSGVWHRFRVLESGRVVEVYWPDGRVRPDDIERADVGGPDPVGQIERDWEIFKGGGIMGTKERYEV